MKRYITLLALIAGLFIGLYLIAQAVQLPILTNPEPFLSSGGLGAMMLGLGLLVADVLLPIPSSLVMTAHGALFGILTGTLLSLAGRAGSFALGYILGMKSLGAVKKLVREEDLARANAALGRWGQLAIIGTRPVPILSETIAIAAGLSKLPFGRSLLAAALGSVPEALLFAITGAAAGGFVPASLVFLGIMAITLLFFIFQSKSIRRVRSRISGKNRLLLRTKKASDHVKKKVDS